MAVSRREFIGGAAFAAGAPLSAQVAGTPPSDRIRVAVIGMGSRGRDHMRLLAKVPGIEVAAFCDPDQTRLRERAAEFEKLSGKKP
ncbi:MAG: gfo/Idh/MocA family oxidoreductase, partial [Bryobacteraceae bacterium]